MSAKLGRGVDELRADLPRLLHEGPRYFPEGMATDQTEEELAAELIREAALLRLRQEIPHALAVDVREIEPARHGVVVRASLLVETESQKGIVVGRGGGMIRDIGSSARSALSRLWGTEVTWTSPCACASAGATTSRCSSASASEALRVLRPPGDPALGPRAAAVADQPAHRRAVAGHQAVRPLHRAGQRAGPRRRRARPRAAGPGAARPRAPARTCAGPAGRPGAMSPGAPARRGRRGAWRPRGSRSRPGAARGAGRARAARRRTSGRSRIPRRRAPASGPSTSHRG